MQYDTQQQAEQAARRRARELPGTIIYYVQEHHIPIYQPPFNIYSEHDFGYSGIIHQCDLTVLGGFTCVDGTIYAEF